jgi:hypothetical protein
MASGCRHLAYVEVTIIFANCGDWKRSTKGSIEDHGVSGASLLVVGLPFALSR